MRSTGLGRSGLPVSRHLCSLYQHVNSPVVVAADGLSKRDVFRLPDPFAVITVDAEQTHTTSVIKKTLNPYWNENFDMFVSLIVCPGKHWLNFAIALSKIPP
jgi:Ca2+-dependent lipid-binding protein